MVSLLFNFVLETAPRKTNSLNTGLYLGSKKCNALAYANIEVLIGKTEGEMKEFLDV